MNDDIKYTITKEDEGLYIKEILQRRFSFSSRLMRKIKVSGRIEVNGKNARLRDRGKDGDLLLVSFPRESSYFEPENIALDIIYEDKDLLLVNKQPWLVVHPTKNYQSGTLANALAWKIRQEGSDYKIRFVNRLDRDTSGLVIVAKNSHCQDFLSSEREKNQTIKKYRAIVHGIVEKDGKVDAPIDKDPDHKARRMVRPDGYPSVTHYKVLETFKAPGIENQGSIEGYSLLELTLETGRTHQIRVHMIHLGHPIVGDELYGQLFGYEAGTDLMNRQALHAYSLEFTQPSTGERIRAKAPLPQDMEACLEYIRKNG